jgi:hypothetical protein
VFFQGLVTLFDRLFNFWQDKTAQFLTEFRWFVTFGMPRTAPFSIGHSLFKKFYRQAQEISKFGEELFLR